VGLRGSQAATWSVYSESTKPGKTIRGEGGYNFFESIVDALRPGLKQGIKSVLVAAPDEKDYQAFMSHIRKHQGWLLKGWGLNTATFEHIREPAMDADQVRDLFRSKGFRARLVESTHVDMRQVMGVLERRLKDPGGIETLLFTLGKVEDAIYRDGRSPEYILITELFMSRNRRRVNRLLQVATNKGVKARVVETDAAAGMRIAQFGGLVCMLRE
jgi:stalled ribosome rescue protein Dom34